MPSAKPSSSSSSSSSSSTSSSSTSTIPPNLAAMFGRITPQQLSSLSTQLGMSADEQSRVSSAMRDPAFLTLLADYAREMSDPEVKRQQEEVLRKMEQEAGVSGGGKGRGGKAGNSTLVALHKQSSTTSELDLD